MFSFLTLREIQPSRPVFDPGSITPELWRPLTVLEKRLHDLSEINDRSMIAIIPFYYKGKRNDYVEVLRTPVFDSYYYQISVNKRVAELTQLKAYRDLNDRLTTIGHYSISYEFNNLSEKWEFSHLMV